MASYGYLFTQHVLISPFEAVQGEKVDLAGVVQEIFDLNMPKPGEIVTGVVTSLVEWGAFVELDQGQWTGMIHISEAQDGCK